MSQYEAILFDFDGVLADSEPCHFESWEEVLKPLGISLDWRTFERYCIGVPDRQVAEFFRGLVTPPVDFETIWAQRPRKQELFLAKMKAKPPFPGGLAGFIRSLAGFKLAVVSASSRMEIAPALEAAGILACFDVIVGTEDVEQTKPAPDPYLFAMRRLGVTMGLAVEDSRAGVASAKAAGLEVLCVESPWEMPAAVSRHLGLPG